MDGRLSFRKVSVLPTEALIVLSRAIEHQTLLLALIGVPKNIRDRFQRMMPERAWLILMDEMDCLGAVRLIDVERAQLEITDVMSTLLNEGYISLTPERKPAYPADEFLWVLRANDNEIPNDTDNENENTETKADKDEIAENGDYCVSDNDSDADDPSMEQILASIREILRQEEAEELKNVNDSWPHQTKVLNQREIDALLGGDEQISDEPPYFNLSSGLRADDLNFNTFDDIAHLPVDILRDQVEKWLRGWHCLVAAVVLARDDIFKAFISVMDEYQTVRFSWELVNAPAENPVRLLQNQRALCFISGIYLQRKFDDINELTQLSDCERQTLVHDLDWGRWCVVAALQGASDPVIEALLDAMNSRDINTITEDLEGRQFTDEQVGIAREWLCASIRGAH